MTVACLQDLSQARARWGPQADGFFSLFSTKVVLPGIADVRTLELISAIGGDERVPVRSVTSPPRSVIALSILAGKTPPTTSVTSSFTWRRSLPVDQVAQGWPGQALVMFGSAIWQVGIQPWWTIPDFRYRYDGTPH